MTQFMTIIISGSERDGKMSRNQSIVRSPLVIDRGKLGDAKDISTLFTLNVKEEKY